MTIEVIESVTIGQVEQSQTAIWHDVDEELGRQLRKWGVQSHAPIYWIGILGEEYGEACKEAIEWGLHASEGESRTRLYSELIHIAAVAISAAECLGRTICVAPAPTKGDDR